LTGPAEMSLHETHMTRCLELARVARDRGETAVGSIVVRGDVVIGEGLEATRSLLDPTLTPRFRPCLQLVNIEARSTSQMRALHNCRAVRVAGYAIRKSGIAQVVYGMPTPQAGAITSSYKILSDETLVGWPPPPAVITGVLAEQCAALLRR
jgi:tRNA(adenine34) deaminase